jgi:hypothetical protein
MGQSKPIIEGSAVRAPTSASQGLRIEDRPIESLIPYARNARTHSPAQVALIAGSIREYGFTNPVLVDGANGIIAGHGRVLGIMTLVAEAEREAISRRTREALARALWRCARRCRRTRRGSRPTLRRWSRISGRPGMSACGRSRRS